MATEVARAGGLTLISDPAIDIEFAAIERPVNPNGKVNEPGHLPIGDPDWVLASAGGVVKILQRNMPRLATHPKVVLRVCVMRRCVAEIRESTRRSFGHEAPSAVHAYDLHFDRLVRSWRSRPDVDNLIVANYVDVVEEPENFVDTLISHGWPIGDRDAAIAIPDPAWYRNRLDPSFSRHPKQLRVDARRPHPLTV